MAASGRHIPAGPHRGDDGDALGGAGGERAAGGGRQEQSVVIVVTPIEPARGLPMIWCP